MRRSFMGIFALTAILLGVSILTHAYTAKTIVTANNANGQPELFFTGLDDSIHHAWRAGGDWSREASLGGFAKQIAAAVNQDGRMEIFYVGTDNHIYHNWQKTAGSVLWHGEEGLSGMAKQISAIRNQDGRLEIFYIGTDDKIYHNYQNAPNSGWFGEAPMGGSAASQINAAIKADGCLDIIYIGADAKIYHNAQTKPGAGPWSGERQLLPGDAKYLTSIKDNKGTLSVIVIAKNGDALKWELNDSGSTGSPFAGGPYTQIDVKFNKLGALVWFATLANPPNGIFVSDGMNETGKQLIAINHPESRLEFFWIGMDNIIYHRYQDHRGLWQAAFQF